jgi:hypothetical protein
MPLLRAVLMERLLMHRILLTLFVAVALFTSALAISTALRMDDCLYLAPALGAWVALVMMYIIIPRSGRKQP